MEKITINDLQGIAYNEYLNVYRNWRNYDKTMSGNALEDNSKYTFADDMVVYLISNDSVNEIDNYIQRVLKRFCKRNKQAYFELILSTMLMSNIFYSVGKDKESELCADWYRKLFFNEETYTKYVTEEEISEMWYLR